MPFYNPPHPSGFPDPYPSIEAAYPTASDEVSSTSISKLARTALFIEPITDDDELDVTLDSIQDVDYAVGETFCVKEYGNSSSIPKVFKISVAKNKRQHL